MGGSTYVAADSPEELESKRLAALEAMDDPGTRAALEGVGIGPGWHCLEAGAGRGSIASWMAERAGGGGRVVAADRDVRFLRRLERPNLEVREIDVTTDAVGVSEFDLVHCRALIMHLTSPADCLRKLAAAVRPGGWLLVEEGDFTTFAAADPLHPAAAEFDRTTRTVWDVMRAAGRMDSYLGRRLPALMEPLNLRDFTCSGRLRVARGGDDVAAFWAHSFRLPAVDAMVNAGVVSQNQIDAVRGLLADPTFDFVVAAVFTACGRRPEA